MPVDNSKVTIIDTKVEPDPHPPRRPNDRVSKEEDQAAELAFQLACEDSTEKNHLAQTTTRARSRVKAAAAELLRSLVALVFAWGARLLLNRSYRKITEQRGVVGTAERAVLALERLLEGFSFRKVIGRRNLLRMLGASRHEDGEGSPVHSLKLAERRYRPGERASGFRYHGLEHAVAENSPVVRVLLGVKVDADDAEGKSLWCLKRFVRSSSGTWTQIYSGYEADAQSALMAFYMEPSPTEQSMRPLEEAPIEEPPEEEPPQAAA